MGSEGTNGTALVLSPGLPFLFEDIGLAGAAKVLHLLPDNSATCMIKDVQVLGGDQEG